MGERTRELIILLVGDILLFFVALWISLYLRYFEVPSEEAFTQHFQPFVWLSVIWIFIFYVAGLYDKHTEFLKSQLTGRIINTQILNTLIAAVFFLVVPFGIAPKTTLVIYLITSASLISWWRLKLFTLFSPKARHRALLIADGPEAEELVNEVNSNARYNYKFVKMVNDDVAGATPDFEEKLLEVIEEEKISIIIANPKSPYIEKLLPLLFELTFLKSQFTFLDFYKVYEDTFDRVPLSSLTYEWFLENVSQSLNLVYDITKRTIDIIGAIFLLVPAFILFPFIILAIKIHDHGPILYRAERVGQHNRIITILKFRTMTGTDVGNAALKSTLTVTKVGSFLRKTRLDELPQLFNILFGDLSFIGPRPEIPSLARVYAESISYYNTRHFIKPGLSGWAQINNYDVPRGGVDIERTKDKLSFDFYYLKHRSIPLDIKIALKTINTLLLRTGT